MLWKQTDLVLFLLFNNEIKIMKCFLLLISILTFMIFKAKLNSLINHNDSSILHKNCKL